MVLADHSTVEGGMIMSLEFWKDALERAIKTAAQFAIVLVGADTFDVMTADWRAVLTAAASGAVISLVTSLGSEPFGTPGTASVVASPDDYVV